MKILVTGGAGFIGSHLVEHYQRRAEEIRVLDNLRTGSRRNLEGLRCTLLEGSITDPVAVARAVAGVDLVFHLAALVSVPESMHNPLECVEINVLGTLRVLESAAVAGVRKLVFASSAAVYGDDPTVPKTEAMAPDPRSPYAITKLDGEWYCTLFQREGRLATAALRFFNVFGPRQNPRGAYAAAVPIFIERARRNEPLVIYGDGEQTRDFIYVKDIVDALAFVAESDTATGVFNAGCEDQITINALATTIVRLTGSRSVLQHQAPRPGDVRHSRASAQRLRDAGWTPRFTLETGLAETLRT